MPEETEDKILGLEDLLGRYRADGVADSSGSFTIDPKKAMERLAEASFEDKYYWILKVIQSLHCSGASQIVVDAGVKSVVLKADVVPQGLGSIHELLAQLLSDSRQADPALRHLAAGLQGSLAVSPNEIRLLAVDDGEQREYLLRAGGWRDGDTHPAPGKPSYFELRLIRNLSEKLGASWFLLNTDIFDLLFGKKGALDRENKVIAQLCNYSRCSVVLGKREMQDRQWGLPRFKGYDIHADSSPGTTKPSGFATWIGDIELVDGWAHPQHHLVEMVVPAGEPGAGFLLDPVSHATLTNRQDPEVLSQWQQNGVEMAVAISAKLDREAVLFFWDDGVLLGQRKISLDCPGLRAMVNAREFGKDITTFKVVDDKKSEELYARLREAGEQLKQKLKENLHLYPVRQRIVKELRLEEP